MLTDDQLVRQIADRDERAFGLLYERHIDAARATARRACRELADDALQDAFFALWRDAGSFRSRPGGAVGWLHTIVRNRGIDLQRQAAVRDRRFVHAEAHWVEPSSPEDAVLASEERARVRAAVADLPTAQREVILLAYAGELTQREIAARQSVALGTVKGRSRLALRRLATTMG